MSKGLIFFFCACGILVFTIINLSIGPIISGKVGYTNRIGGYWNTANCAYYSYLYDEAKKTKSGNELKYDEKWTKTECERKKAMYNMEYTSFIFNIVIGFVCSLLGLLHYFEVKKEFVVKTGIIGLVCGIVGFALSLVYVIFNGIVYTTYYDTDTNYKTDGDGAFAEWKNDKYECFYYDEPNNKHAIVAKYSDLRKKQYNYNNDLYKAFNSIDSEAHNCQRINPSACLTNEGYITTSQLTYGYNPVKKCDHLYYYSNPVNNSNKDKSDRFLTALIMSLLVCLANIGLAIFGFLLFRTGEF